MNMLRETRAQRKWREYRETSRQAFAARPGVTLDSRILGYLALHGPASDAEMERVLDVSHQTISGNRAWLAKDGLVRDSGQRGRTRSGRACIKWELTPPEAQTAQGSLFGGAGA